MVIIQSLELIFRNLGALFSEAHQPKRNVPNMDYSATIRPNDLKQLEQNWIEQQKVKGTSREMDLRPVIKLFSPVGSATILVSEKDPEGGLSFGIVDLGFGAAEMGYLDLEEVLTAELPMGLRMEQDLYWTADKTLSQYADAARRNGGVLQA
ncbi:DUF2958 domain-containing protein [Sphingobium sp. HT1-2]|uniref:DUF2958 domain-containing protein n=1 Tax=Sphingobium sp. HT1-2 TaxID=3111640 RepID=UPI003C04974E